MATAAAVELAPLVGSGQASPLFVTAAGDGSNRLSIAERGGLVRPLPSGATTTSVFLNVRGKLVAGDERGLLGLAFHPRCVASASQRVTRPTRVRVGELEGAPYARAAPPRRRKSRQAVREGFRAVYATRA